MSGEMVLAGQNGKIRRKIRPSAAVHHATHMDRPMSKSGLRGEKLATNACATARAQFDLDGLLASKGWHKEFTPEAFNRHYYLHSVSFKILFGPCHGSDG
jgi:hypothetical protein